MSKYRPETIEQLELAKQAGGSFYQLSAIESELRELREMIAAPDKSSLQ